MDFESFHFLRPYWLVLIPLIIFWVLRFGHLVTGSNAWSNVIDAHLLQFLSHGSVQKQSATLRKSLLLAALLTICLALAGPAWEKIPSPVFSKAWSRVFVLDLSFSMDASDLKPSRLARAKYKLHDLLDAINEGEVALVVYAGDAFVISPLTTDTNTVQNLIPALGTDLMPVLGSRLDLAIAQANELLNNNRAAKGEIIVISDGIENEEVNRVKSSLKASQFPVHVLMVGTAEGAPVPIPGQGLLKDARGNLVLPKLNIDLMQEAFSARGSQLLQIQNDNSDVEALITDVEEADYLEDANNEQESDEWHDMGQYLMLLTLPLALFLFHRKTTVLVVLLAISISPKPSYAWSWTDLWQNKNQQAKAQFEADKHESAAETFQDPDWKAAAQYKAGNFEEALAHYQQGSEAKDFYNAGNAHAKLGQLEEALAAYNKALELNPNDAQTKKNKKIIEDLLKQQQEQNEQKDDQQQQDEQEQNEDQEQDGKQQDEQQQDGQQQDGQQQDGQQQDGQQQDGQQQDGQQQDGQQQDGQQQDGQQQDGQQQDGQQQNGQQQDGQQRDGQQQNGQQQDGQQQDGQQQDGQQQDGQQQQADNPELGDHQEEEIEGAENQQAQAQTTQEAAEDASNQDNAPVAPIARPKEGAAMSEEERRIQQWLNKIPDDPGRLLREKMYLEARKRRRQKRENKEW